MIEIGETKGEKGAWRGNSKARAKTDSATTLSMVEEANASSVGDNQICSNGRSGEDKYSDLKGTGDRNGLQKRPLCHGGG